KHSWLAGRVGAEAFLDDYSFLAAGMLDLFELTSNERWLREAIRLTDALEQRHADRVHGGYFLTAEDQDQLLARNKPDSDAAVPSGNSVALMNQLRLAELTTADRFRLLAETTLRAFAAALDQRVVSLSEMMLGVDFQADEPKEIAVVLPAGTTRDDAE